MNFVSITAIFAKAWSIIKRWLDKRILEKIFICGTDYKDVLLQHIDAENLPDFLGGKCTCSHMPGGCVPSPYLESKKASAGGDNFQHTTSLGSVHEYQLTVPEEELEGSKANLTYKFKTTKRAVEFEIRHRKTEDDKERVVLPATSMDSHKQVVQANVAAEPGTYVLSWQKPSGGFSLFNSIALDYSVDLEIENGEEYLTEHLVLHEATGNTADSEERSDNSGDTAESTEGMANMHVK